MGDSIVVAGFVPATTAPRNRIVLRGLGASPAPGSFHATAVLADPMLELRDSNGVLLASNNDWQDNAVRAAYLSKRGQRDVETIPFM